MKSTITYVAGYDPLSPAALRREFAPLLEKIERDPVLQRRAAPRAIPLLILRLSRHVLSAK